MTTTVLSVPAGATITEVALVLYTGAVRAVPVLDGTGRLLGVVSEADVLATADREPADDHRWWRYRPRHTHRTRPEPRIGARTAQDLMTTPPVTIAPETTVACAARMMRKHGLAWLPVVDPDGGIVGVLGRSDLLAVFMRGDDVIRTEVVDEVLGQMLLVDSTRIAVEVADGVVTLTGELDTRGDATLAVQFVERLEGVVEVVDRLSYRLDDRTVALPVAPLY